MYPFEFLTPQSVSQAASALQNPEAVALGGGQTLIPTLKQRLAMPEVVVSLAGIPALLGISQSAEDSLRVGAMMTHAAVARGAGAYPALTHMAAHIGDPAVRNRGTIGGSLANNDPSACYPAAVLASGAPIVTNKREIGAADYFQGMFTTALDEGELITEVQFPIPIVAAYQKFVQPASRFALVGVFVAKFTDGVRVAVTGASEEGVFRWTQAEAALNADFKESGLETINLPPDGMIADIHGSDAYRAHLVGVLTKRAVAQILDAGR